MFIVVYQANGRNSTEVVALAGPAKPPGCGLSPSCCIRSDPSPSCTQAALKPLVPPLKGAAPNASYGFLLSVPSLARRRRTASSAQWQETSLRRPSSSEASRAASAAQRAITQALL